MIRFAGNRRAFDELDLYEDLPNCREFDSDAALQVPQTWDAQYEQIRDMIFDGEHDLHLVEEMLDCCDYARRKAARSARLWTIY